MNGHEIYRLKPSTGQGWRPIPGNQAAEFPVFEITETGSVPFPGFE